MYVQFLMDKRQNTLGAPKLGQYYLQRLKNQVHYYNLKVKLKSGNQGGACVGYVKPM